MFSASGERPRTHKSATETGQRDSWEDLMTESTGQAAAEASRDTEAPHGDSAQSEDELQAFRLEAAKRLADAVAEDAARAKAIAEGLSVEELEKVVEDFERHKSTPPPATKSADEDNWSKLAA